MHQQTFAEVTFEQYRKLTRRERFLDEMNRVVPWAELVTVLEPVYPKADGPGRPPVGVDRMLRLHGLQQRCWLRSIDSRARLDKPIAASYGTVSGRALRRAFMRRGAADTGR